MAGLSGGKVWEGKCITVRSERKDSGYHEIRGNTGIYGSNVYLVLRLIQFQSFHKSHDNHELHSLSVEFIHLYSPEVVQPLLPHVLMLLSPR